MKADGSHEGCIEQIDGLFRRSLYGSAPVLDDVGRLRADGLEMRPEIQNQVAALWSQVNDDNIDTLTDFKGYQQEFLRLFGFGVDGVDYEADVDPVVPIAGLIA
jgi:enoyl-[acyl-carrier protein] reductase/trans-2-enoyl-CoA reductase (NAD+)